MMKYIKTFEQFINESTVNEYLADYNNSKDIVLKVKTRSNKKHEYTRDDIRNFADDINLNSDDLPKWLYVYFMELDSRSRNPHKTSKYAKKHVEDKLNDLVKYKGKPELLDLNI